LNVKSLNFCGGHQQIIIPYNNISFRVSDACELFVKSCTLKKPYSTAKLELSFYKGKSRLFKENNNLCSNNRRLKEMTQVMLDVFGVNNDCPVSQNKVSKRITQ
jgi:hypothetical protein